VTTRLQSSAWSKTRWAHRSISRTKRSNADVLKRLLPVTRHRS
jgi:hypothetical protein